MDELHLKFKSKPFEQVNRFVRGVRNGVKFCDSAGGIIPIEENSIYIRYPYNEVKF